MEAEDATGTTVAIYRGSSTKPFARVPVYVDAGGKGYFSRQAEDRAVGDDQVQGGLGRLRQLHGRTTTCKVHRAPGSSC